MFSLLAGLVIVLLLYVASRIWFLGRNYRAACTIGLPTVVCPFDPDGLVYSILSVPLRPVLRYILPAVVFATIELSIWGWEFHDKGAIHEKLGPVFVLVTTGKNRLVCADPAMARTILARRRDFNHPEITTQAMGFLGSNLVTAHDESWSRQRRIVAPALNERISSEVWRESAEQASSLAEILLSSSPPQSAGVSVQTILGLRTIAINVLACIAYGHRKPFALPSSSRSQSRDLTMDISYVDAISLCTELFILAAFLPARLLRMPVMPRLLQKLGIALTQLPDLTRDMLDQERRRSRDTVSGVGEVTAVNTDRSNTIMSTLVRLSDQEKEQLENKTSNSSEEKKSVVRDSSGSSYLTEEEIAGNLFVFTAAGFDTTANTMSYAVTLLAVYPEWQTWIQNEIDNVLGGPPAGQEDEILPDYETTFPKLMRCMAVMLETLRLFPPVTLMMRSSTIAQTIPSEHSPAGSFLLPAPCTIYINTTALHASTSTWGADALEFNPARWLQPGTGGESQVLMTPPRGTYIPWSSGPRTCPGQKMSQVEFVTVIATLFRKCTAKPMLKKGENMQQARQRLMDLMQDSQILLTLQMNKPKDVHLDWAKR